MKNKLKTTLIVLIIILISLVSFGGIYVAKGNMMQNLVKEYKYSMDFSDRYILNLEETAEESSDEESEESATSEETQTEGQAQEQESAENTETTEQTENSEEQTQTNEQTEVSQENELNNVDTEKVDVNKTKQIINKRLKYLGVEEYYIRANEKDGTISLELPSETDLSIIENVISKGEFQIIDSDETTVLADHTDIKDVKYALDRTTYTIPCVQISMQFTEEFVNDLVNRKDQYISEVDEEGNTVDKYIYFKIDGTTIYSELTTDFIDVIKPGKSLTLYFGEEETTEQLLQQYYTRAAGIANSIKNGPLPADYEVNYSNVVKSNLNIMSVIIVGLIILAIMIIFIIIKYKSKGLYGAVSLIGYIACILLVLRYTNIIIAFEGVFAIALIIAINYLFTIAYIKNTKTSKNEKPIRIYINTLLQFMNVIIICLIISIVFLTQSWTPIMSFGTIMFWGIIMLVTYNYFVTKNLISNTKK